MKPTTKISVGRVLHAYSNRWAGPRPAIVVNAFPGSAHANVNVFLDGANDRTLLAERRSHAEGNTFCSVPVYELEGDETPPVIKPETPADVLSAIASLDGRGFAVFCVFPMRGVEAYLGPAEPSSN